MKRLALSLLWLIALAGAALAQPTTTRPNANTMLLTNCTTSQILLGGGALATPLCSGSGTTKSVLQGATGSAPTFTTTPTTAGLTVNNNAAAVPAPPGGALVQIGNADATNSGLVIDTFGVSGFVSQLIFRKARNTAATPQALQTDDPIGGMYGIGYGATGYSSTGRAFSGFFAAETWTDTAQGAYQAFYTTPTGAAAMAERMRINPSGDLRRTNMAAPASPAAGFVTTWGDTTDLRFHDKNSAGTIGTTVVASTAGANQFATGVSSSGVVTYAQPAMAAQSDQETATSTTTFVSPGRQQFHPSAAKAWAYWTVSGGVIGTQTGYNATVTHNAGGDNTITFSTAFSSVNYAVVCTHGTPGSTLGIGLGISGGRAAGSYREGSYTTGVVLTDFTENSCVMYGDQ